MNHDEIQPGDVGEAKPGDVFDVDANGQMVLVPRWSPRWIRVRLHGAFVSVLDWFRALRLYWYGFKVGVVHGKESPGCGLSRARVELRFDPIRGEHFYCHGCQRPIHFSGVERIG
jgi:hypothetical protein